MADTPLFYYPQKLQAGEIFQLPEDTARHIGQVLRMEAGEPIQLTDGNGMLADCHLSKVEKKRVEVSAGVVEQIPQSQPAFRLGIAFTKNASRNEWLLEKATELGISRITPLLAERSNRERIRAERWNAILISAMLQSKQSWLPQLDAPMSLKSMIDQNSAQLFIAHCMDTDARVPLLQALKKGQNACMLIGPEGDFSRAEVTLASSAGAIPVSLGSNRLRTETAALAAITHFYLLNHASSD